MSLSLLASRQLRSAAVRSSQVRPSSMASRRRLLSSKPETGPPPTLQNIGLASALAGFTFFVFRYSMNAVGKGDAEDDPLAQLKEEAQDARQLKDNEHKRKLSKEEIAALESGLTVEHDGTTKLEVAVAAPADIAQLEETANLKVFQQKQGDKEKKKKPWWRFGF